MTNHFEIGDVVVCVNNRPKGVQINANNISLPLVEGAEYIIADIKVLECCNSVKLDVGIKCDDVTEQQCRCGGVYRSGPKIWLSEYRFVKLQPQELAETIIEENETIQEDKIVLV